MKLTDAELKQLDEEGYLFFPSRFSPEEARLLKQAADDVYAMEREEVWREKSGVARTAFAAHTYNEPFRRLGAHPRLVDPVSQVLDSDLYMHQFKVNAKLLLMAMRQWHQDYGTWKRVMKCLNHGRWYCGFLDDVTQRTGLYCLSPAAINKGLSRQAST